MLLVINGVRRSASSRPQQKIAQRQRGDSEEDYKPPRDGGALVLPASGSLPVRVLCRLRLFPAVLGPPTALGAAGRSSKGSWALGFRP